MIVDLTNLLLILSPKFYVYLIIRKQNQNINKIIYIFAIFGFNSLKKMIKYKYMEEDL